jgi:uncharacterized protein
MHTEAQIDSLNAILDDIEMMPDAMCVSELDGYVAGLLLCPEMIPPSEWLPEVWGLDIEPEFRSRRQAEAATSAIIEYYNRVAECLATNPAAYEIVLEHSAEDDTPFWEFWIAGFEQAMQLRLQSWGAYLDCEDQDALAGFSILASLVQLENLESDLPKDDQEELEAAAPDLIPEAVVSMNKWLKRQAAFPSAQPSGAPFAANTNTRPAHSIKTGRNDPCPCGSGQKYKKCCLVDNRGY